MTKEEQKEHQDCIIKRTYELVEKISPHRALHPELNAPVEVLERYRDLLVRAIEANEPLERRVELIMMMTKAGLAIAAIYEDIKARTKLNFILAGSKRGLP